MEEHILIVDDEESIADLLEVCLKNENYIVHKFYNAADALKWAEEQEPDLAILDVMLPDMDGFDLCCKIRQRHRYPVIMLTAKDAETDKIMGLTLGADDYMTKPFRPLELVARVKAQLRRYKRYNESASETVCGDVLNVGDLFLDVKKHRCHLHETPVSLTPTEFSILRVLLERKGAVVGSEELFHALWADEYYSKSNNTITVHIRHLREKLREAGETKGYIKTVWGVGYKIEE